MGSEFTKSQIDRLGDRLRQGSRSEDDLRMLDTFRRSFNAEYSMVLGNIRSRIHQEPTGRPAKSTNAISEKLNRESIRLSQIQDIAGCRILVAGFVEQNRIVDSLRAIFPDTVVVDRRSNPSHGYRAVHVIVRINGTPIEVQIRTKLQHLWAELSEKLSDVLDPGIKYGSGNEHIREMLKIFSSAVAEQETFQKMVMDIEDKPLDDQDQETLENLKQKLNVQEQQVAEGITRVTEAFEHVKGEGG